MISNSTLQRKPDLIRKIENPTKEQLEIAGMLSSLHHDDYEKCRLRAVELNPFSIALMHNPSIKVQLAAVDKNKRSIAYIKDPFRYVMDTAKNLYFRSLALKVREYEYERFVLDIEPNIKKLPVPLDQIEIAIVGRLPCGVGFVENVCESAQLHGISLNSHCHTHIEKPSQLVNLIQCLRHDEDMFPIMIEHKNLSIKL